MKENYYLSAIAAAAILIIPNVSGADERTQETQMTTDKKSPVVEVEEKAPERESAAEIKNQDVAPTAKPGSASNTKVGTSYKEPSGETSTTSENAVKVTPGVSAGGNAGSATNTGSGANTKDKGKDKE